MAAQNHTQSASLPKPSKLCEVCGSPTKGKPSHAVKRRFCSVDCMRQAQVGEGNPNWRGGFVDVDCLHCGSPMKVMPGSVNRVRYCSKACLARAQESLFRGENSPKWKGGQKASKARYRERIRASQSITAVKANQSPGPNFGHLRVVRTCKKCGVPGLKKGCLYHPECSPCAGNKRITFRCVDCGFTKQIFPIPGHTQLRCVACENKNRTGANNSNWKGGITPINKKIRASDRYKAWRKAVFDRDNYTCIWCGQRGFTLHADHIKPFARFPRLRFTVSNGRTLCVECHKKTDTYLSKGKKRRKPLRQLSLGFSD